MCNENDLACVSLIYTFLYIQLSTFWQLDKLITVISDFFLYFYVYNYPGTEKSCLLEEESLKK